MNFIDMRSDTVTHPTPAMRAAMAKADVGDDVFGDDPTVNKLQEKAAAMLGKEDALYVASGTMGNLVAVLAHCGRGDEVILGNLGHTFLYEAGGIAALGGVHPYPLQNQTDGTLDLTTVKAAVRAVDDHFPTTRLLILENTQNRCGGVALPVEYMRQAGDLVHSLGFNLHLDGARLFNAAAALNVKAVELAEPADSVTFCLSKALCAPVGSVLCGTHEFITKARRIRKMLGGGMRQAGVLAAAGIVALDEMVDRLPEDHARAKRLAACLAAIPGLQLDPGSPATNMIFLNLDDKGKLSAKEVAVNLETRGIKVQVTGPKRFRLVIHYWIDDAAVDQTANAFGEILRG
jgi:threonine aldolase